jgi:hypothetical protein
MAATRVKIAAATVRRMSGTKPLTLSTKGSWVINNKINTKATATFPDTSTSRSSPSFLGGKGEEEGRKCTKGKNVKTRVGERHGVPTVFEARPV